MIATTFNTGIITSCVACNLMVLLTQVSFSIFTRAWSFGQAYSFDEIWSFTFGPAFSWIPKVLLIVGYESAAVAGFGELSVAIPDILSTFWPNVPTFILSPWFIQYILMVPVSLPCLLVDNMGWFGWNGWMSLCAFVVGIGCLVCQLFRTQWNGGYAAASRVAYVRWGFDLNYAIFANYNLMFFAHSFIAPIAQEMENPTRSRTLRMTWIAFIVAAICSYFAPLLGYLLFTDVEPGMNVFYYLNPNDPEVIVGKIAILIMWFLSMHVLFYHMATLVARMISEGAKPGHPVFWSSIVLALPAVCINVAGGTLMTAIFEGGSVAFCLLGFVLPPLYYLWQFRYRHLKWGLTATAVLVIGIAFLALQMFSIATSA
jgi:hypothetical protein